MVLFIVCSLIVGFLCWLIVLKLCECTKIDDTSEVDDTELDHIPTKADIEQYNEQVRQQRATARKKAEQHISSILDKAYKDYVYSKIKDNSYIDNVFIICEEEYGITYSEILAISRPFTYSIYNVECPYSDDFYKYYIKVTVNN